jgi:MFS superfamily sulfate permease-like transporter
MQTESAPLAQDLLASVVVFLVALPLCMGIAIASGAPPAAGLITGVIGGLVVGALSGCALQVSGPAAGLAVIVYDLIQTYGMAGIAPIILLAGAMQIAAATLRLGQMFRAIGPSVIYGMLAGIGILIFGAQFHVMVDDSPRENGLANLLSIPMAIYKGVMPIDGSTHHQAAFLGMVTIVVVLLWTAFAPAKLKWVPGALLGVVAATGIATAWSMPVRYVDLPDNLIGSLQFASLDSFSILAQPAMYVVAAGLAFVASAETLLSAAAVDQMHDGPRTNYDRELLSQGVGNALSGFLGGLPMTGVIVRSATNVAAGAKTRRSAMLHGAWLLLFVVAFPRVLQLVPTSSLAAILVYTGYKLVNPNNIKRLLGYGVAPFLTYAVTVIVIVSVDLLAGIITGIALSLLKVLWALSRLNIEVTRQGSQRVDVTISGAATFLRLPKLVDTLSSLPEGVAVHVHLAGMQYIDHACFDAISTWERQWHNKRGTVVLEWDDLMSRYRGGNQFGPMGAGNLQIIRAQASGGH